MNFFGFGKGCLLEKGSNHKSPFLGGRFGYFLFFSARGGGGGSSRRQERGGGRFLIENPRRGGGVSRRGRGFPGGLFGANWGFLGGGGAKYFFSGPKRPPRFSRDSRDSRDS